MRHLRMLTNALVGGVLGAMYLLVLVLQVNPHVPVASLTALWWFGSLVALYGPYLTVALYLLLLVREGLASRPLAPAWLSVRLLAWLSAAGAAGAAAITWLNLEGFRAVLSGAAAGRMREGAIATTVFALILLTIAVLRYSFGRRGSRATGVLLIGALLLSVAVPLWLRGPGDLPVPAARRTVVAPPAGAAAPRVRLLLLDGASLGFLRERVAAGQLPHFGRLLTAGAAMDLATLRPTQAAPVWAAAATGKYPPKNGVRSNAIYRVRPDETEPVDLLPDYCFARALVYQGFVREEPVTAAALRARPLWDILADYGLAAGVVAWPLTYPARAERGFVVSDAFDEAASSPLRLADAQAGHPTTAVDVAREVFDRVHARPWFEFVPGAAPGEPAPPGAAQARWDRAYVEAADELEALLAPRLIAVRLEGIDVIGHVALRDAQPERFGDVRRAGASRSLLDRYYTWVDAEVGRAVARLAPGDLLLVVSGFGLEPVGLVKRLFGGLLGESGRTGTHEAAPDGFLLAYGTNVARGQVRRGSIVDLAPTVLYYMGLSVGRDLDGFARSDLFLRSYTIEHPVTYIATHER